jgi:hypothetical protein
MKMELIRNISKTAVLLFFGLGFSTWGHTFIKTKTTTTSAANDREVGTDIH